MRINRRKELCRIIDGNWKRVNHTSKIETQLTVRELIVITRDKIVSIYFTRYISHDFFCDNLCHCHIRRYYPPLYRPLTRNYCIMREAQNVLRVLRPRYMCYRTTFHVVYNKSIFEKILGSRVNLPQFFCRP